MRWALRSLWIAKKSVVPAGLHLFLVLACVSFPVPASEPPARPLTASEFAALIQRLSEEGGYFWNDNFVSNEASYLHPLGKLRELGIEGGIYLGVGPNQNFTYIAKIKPRYAFIIDIRRQNFLQHLLFKAIFHFARNRADYLSILLSRPLPDPARFSANCPIDDLVGHFQAVDPSVSLYRRNRSRIHSYLKRAVRVTLSDQDFEILDKVHGAFFLRGLSIKYDYIPVATYGEFLRERDLEGNQHNFLNSSREFEYLKRMHAENRILPIVGDFAGPHTLREIGQHLKGRKERVTVFYTSNVEQYLIRNQNWLRFLVNVRELPLDDRAVFIRAYWSSRIPHPDAVSGYTFTQILQWAKPFLKNFDEKGDHTYWEIVTTDTIKLR